MESGRGLRSIKLIPPEPVQMNEQFFTACGRRRVRDGQGNAEQSVGAEPAFVRSTVKFDEPGVEAGLIVEVPADDGRGDFADHVVDSPGDAQTAKARVFGVA